MWSEVKQRSRVYFRGVRSLFILARDANSDIATLGSITDSLYRSLSRIERHQAVVEAAVARMDRSLTPFARRLEALESTNQSEPTPEAAAERVRARIRKDHPEPPLSDDPSAPDCEVEGDG